MNLSTIQNELMGNSQNVNKKMEMADIYLFT
jgi:hypothetical protein